MRAWKPSIWLLVYAIALFSDSAFFVFVSGWATSTRGPEFAGFVLAAGAVPRAFLLVPGGALADRLGAWRISLVGAALRVAALGCLLVAVFVPDALGPLLIASSVSMGLADAAFIPATSAMPPLLVERSQLARLQSWRIAALRLGNILGPVAGGFLLVLPVASASALFVLTGVLVFLGMAALKLSQREKTVREKAQGDSGLRSVARLWPLFLGMGLAEIPFAGPFGAAVVMWLEGSPGGATRVGWILAMFSVGGVAGAFAVSQVSHERVRAVIAAISNTAAAVVLVVFSLTDRAGLEWASLILGLMTGMALSCCYTLMQELVPADRLGRVSSLVALVPVGASPLLLGAAGIVTAAFGAEYFFRALAVFLVLAGCAMALLAQGMSRQREAR